jgi:hypothetical protein
MTTPLDFGKMPPQAIELEESILGAILLESNAIRKVDFLKAETFYKDAHKKIYQAAFDLLESGSPIDCLTVQNQLRIKQQLDEVGGSYYISQLMSRVASSSNIEFHARIIYQKFIQRELIRISSDIQSKAYDDFIDVGDLIDFAKQSLDFKLEFTNKIQTLEQCRLNIEDELNKPPALLEILQGKNSIKICKRANITSLKGKSKAGKTTTAVMLMATLLMRGKLMDKFYCPYDNLNLIVFDTEESKYDALTMIRIMCKLRGITKHPKNLTAFSLKTFNAKRRIRYLREYIYNNEVDVILLDGVKDLVRNINSPEEATDISDEVMRWNEERNCQIIGLIHENKDLSNTNMRGHLGTEFTNRSESVISSNREPDNESIFTITDDYPRGREKFEPISWKYVNDMPEITTFTSIQKKLKKGDDEECPF